MRNVICCWCNGDSTSFENHVPLLFVGERNLKLGFKNDIDILFLHGYELLNENYRSALKGIGYELSDAQKIFLDLDKKYDKLEMFGSYEKKCFLRWLVISQYFCGEHITHYDGDVIFNEDPRILRQALSGKTFVLQGCPALTCISDQTWFLQYQEQLALFSADIKGYSEKAWMEREGWESSHQQKWAGSRCRRIISSDQDFISHLIHTDRIIQDRPYEVLKDLDSYIFFENPLYIGGYTPYRKERPFKYVRKSGIDYLNEKRVALWHMQSDFNYYLGKFIFRKKTLKRTGIIPGRLRNHLEGRSMEDYLFLMFNKISGGRNSSRLAVYKYFFEESDLGEVLTDKVWWDTGVFI